MRHVACLLVGLMIAVTTLDRVVCPDGCTDDGASNSSASTSACPLCHAWSPATIIAGHAPVSRMPSRHEAQRARECASHPRVIDHPPKFA